MQSSLPVGNPAYILYGCCEPEKVTRSFGRLVETIEGRSPDHPERPCLDL